MVTAQEMVAKLKDVPKGAQVFVSYLAGRPAKPRALREAERASEEGYAKRWFQGRLESVWTTKKGEPVMCVFTHTRYNEDEPQGGDGHYRTFNPALGTMLSLEVIQ